jgi:lipopolysaccharide export system permease protein
VTTSNAARGELLWRIGMPVSALILSLLAIPLSYVNPRAGRSANMLIAILIYAIYSQSDVGQPGMGGAGQAVFLGSGASAIHAPCASPCVILFYHRMAVPRRLASGVRPDVPP